MGGAHKSSFWRKVLYVLFPLTETTSQVVVQPQPGVLKMVVRADSELRPHKATASLTSSKVCLCSRMG